jgi:hypothetical protein
VHAIYRILVCTYAGSKHQVSGNGMYPRRGKEVGFMNLRTMRPNEATKHHFVPQAVINRPVSFFASSGVSFHKGHDDLDDTR